MFQNHSNYLEGVSDPTIMKRIVKHAIHRITTKGLIDKFDTILYTGLSGSLIATPLAYELDKKLCAVRKDTNHSGKKLEGIIGKKSLILDDFIDQGKTVENIVDAVKNRTTIVGMYCYLWSYDHKRTSRMIQNQYRFPVFSCLKEFNKKQNDKWKQIRTVQNIVWA